MGNVNKQVTPKSKHSSSQGLGPLQPVWINAATFKFGAQFSPFEYYFKSNIFPSYPNFEKELNDTLVKVSDTIKLNEQQLKIMRQISSLTKGRYTPLHNRQAGMHGNCYLLNEAQFGEQWDKAIEKIMANIQDGSKQQKKKLTKSQKRLQQIFETQDEDEAWRHLKKFDLNCYHALLTWAYKTDTTITIDQIANNNYSYHYQHLMNEVFDSPINSLSHKIAKIISYIKSAGINVLFLQQMSPAGMKALQKELKGFRLLSSEVKKQGQSITTFMIKNELFCQLDPTHKSETLASINRLYLPYRSLSSEQVMNNPQLIKHGFSSTPTKIDKSKKKNMFVNHLEPLRVDRSFLCIPETSKQETPTGEDYRKEQENNISDGMSFLKSRLTGNWTSEEPNTRSTASRYTPIDTQIRELRTKTQYEEGISAKYLKLRDPEMIKQYQAGKINQDGQQIEDKNIVYALKLLEGQVPRFRFSDETVLQFVGNMIFISSYLEDKKREERDKDMERILQGLRKLRQKYTRHHILMGLSLQNSHEQNQDFCMDEVKHLRSDFYCIPDIPAEIKSFSKQTNSRSRTYLLQNHNLFTENYHKSKFRFEANVPLSRNFVSCNQYIISTSPIYTAHIQKCENSMVSSKDLLPSPEHPFINYLVRGRIYLKPELVKIKKLDKIDSKI